MVTVALATGRDVGVDVEDAARRGRTVELADRFFAPSEVAALRALPEGAAQRDRFFRLWTLKESYIKARGQGLAIPLSGFAFALDGAGSAIGFSARPEVDDDAARWRFFGLRPSERHQLAVAVAAGPSAPVRVRVRWASAA
ncbi:MAG: 4'-phosphopantetheinyl transferase superfamily protein [Deltaproteobacteria bacterium]|nr:MAG: 4'-phosphopantetheinyl transferase superfamily protein [Deltaproteobacteria bacterium]